MRLSLLATTLAAGLHWTGLCSAEVVTEGDIRILRVRAVADEEFREREDWQSVIEEHLVFAANFYEKTFDTRLEVVDLVEWESDDTATLSELVDRMEDEVSLNGVDVALGFSAQRANRGKLSKYVPLAWGLTPALGRVSLIRATDEGQSYDLHLALVHEIAHLFGAFHVAEQGYVMRETVQGPRTFQFDVENGKLLRLMKEYDFEKGAAALDTRVRERITYLWRRGGVRHDNNPLAEGLFNVGIDLRDAGQTQAAIEVWREAAQYDGTFAAPYGLVGIALADMQDYEGALKELEIAARLGWPEARQVMQLIVHQQASTGKDDARPPPAEPQP